MTKAAKDTSAISSEIVELILAEGGVDRAKLTPNATLETLGLQSIDLVMAMMTIEEKYGVYIPLDADLAEVKNFEGLVNSIANRIFKEQEKSAG